MPNTIPAYALRLIMANLGEAERLSRSILPQLHAAGAVVPSSTVAGDLGRLTGTITGVRDMLLKYGLVDVEVEAEVVHLSPQKVLEVFCGTPQKALTD